MPRETVAAKAERLVREDRVEILWVRSDELWSAIVTGDSAVYCVEGNPDENWCECPAGSYGRCSHFAAALAVVLSGVPERSPA